MKKRLFFLCLAVFAFVPALDAQEPDMQQLESVLERAESMMGEAVSENEFRAVFDMLEAAEDDFPDNGYLLLMMALCAEEIASYDRDWYGAALEYYRGCRIAGRELFDAETLSLIDGKVEDMEFAVELASKMGLSSSSLCGKWSFHYSGGRERKLFDMEITENDEGFFVVYTACEERSNSFETLGITTGTAPVTIEDDRIMFIVSQESIIYENPGQKRQFEQTKEIFRFMYDLSIQDGTLVGIQKADRYYMAIGSDRFRTVEEAVRRGKGYVMSDCYGNCGTENVYFVKEE